MAVQTPMISLHQAITVVDVQLGLAAVCVFTLCFIRNIFTCSYRTPQPMEVKFSTIGFVSRQLHPPEFVYPELGGGREGRGGLREL